MAKKAILEVLESTIGKYVKNLDAESLNVAVWSGKIQLHSLELNIDAVNAELDRQAAEAPNFAIPFRVTGGRFGSFEVDVPWARITSRPVVLRAKGLEVFVEVYDRVANLDHLTAVVSNEQKRIQHAKAYRSKSINVSDDYRKQSNTLRKLADVDDGEKDSKDGKGSFGGRLVRRIAENLQVEIDDVHISLKGCESAAGVVLASLSLVTTDKNGMRTFVDRTVRAKTAESTFLYKVLSIKGLGIYLEEEENVSTRPFKITEDRIEEGKPKTSEHSYILAPLSFEASLRQSDDTKCIHFPKYLLSSELSQLSVLLSRNQLELGQRIFQTIKSSDHVAIPVFPEYRPLVRVSKESAREWWMYATRCVLRLNGRRSWVEFFVAFQKRRKYIPLYKRMAHSVACTWLTKLSKDEQIELALLEVDRSISVEGIMGWRNIADAQMDLEQEKHNATRKKDAKNSGLMKNFFASKGKSSVTLQEDLPPIELTAEEMKELEVISQEQSADAELSKDSCLCDLRLILGSFKINLSTHGMTPLASLFLGMVTTSFDAKVDGSFNFKLKLSSVLIHDAVTVKSLYRTILRNLASPDGLTSSDNSFELHLSKSTDGHQNVALKMVAFEMVASPILFVEIKRFFSSSQRASKTAVTKKNPLLAQSISGSVDLFYDAVEGKTKMLAVDVLGDSFMAEAEAAANHVSSTLLAVWKNKVLVKKLLTIDFDIHAPIIIVPEDCVRNDAIALVFDLGHLRVRVGNIEVPKKVFEWSGSHRIDNGENQLDPGSLLIEKLTFSMSTTQQLLSNNNTGREEQRCKTIVEPLSINLDFGIDTSDCLESPRMCAFGIFPAVTVRLSPSQLSRMAKVVKQWIDVKEKITYKVDAQENGGISILDKEESPQPTLESTTEGYQTVVLNSSATFTVLFVTLALQRFSVYFHQHDEAGVEAHLVSVSVSSATLSDGKVCNNLCMGWFWLLDRLVSKLPRSQRLLAHSNLPRLAEEFAVNDKYDIFGDLEKLGVFSDDFVGSNELADISAVFTSPSRIVSSEDFYLEQKRQMKSLPSTELVLDMKFTSLFVNWNPSVLKAMVQCYSEAFTSFDERSQYNFARITPVNQISTSSLGEKSIFKKLLSSLLLNAQLQHLEIFLNSARDDLPLFTLSMSGTRVSVLSTHRDEQEILASLELGDVKVTTPNISSTRPMYRSLLGLIPSHSASLLSIQCFMGKGPLDSAIFGENIDGTKCEAYATVELSPMRVVYIQAQVLTLIEYINDGVLGTIAARAASSAANAALDIVSSEIGEKLFSIKAVGFDLIIPQAASSENHFFVHAGDLKINHRAFSAPGGGTTRFTLSEVYLQNGLAESMVDTPVTLEIKVDIPPDNIGSMEDQTILADIKISEASFLLRKGQYQQILRMLDCNISEADPFLRENIPLKTQTVEVQEKAIIDIRRLITHAGIAMVEKTRRLNLDLHIALLSLETYHSSLDEPLASVSAEKTRIKFQILPDKDQLRTTIILHNFICQDRRITSSSRQFLNLIAKAHGDPGERSRDVFFIAVAKDRRVRSTDVTLKIGSPQIVFVPDAIADILSFLMVNESEHKMTFSNRSRNLTDNDSIEVNGKSNETKVLEENETISLSLATGDCSIVLVDMGSAALAEAGVSRTLTTKGYQTQLTESIVLQGKFKAELKIETKMMSMQLEKIDLDLYGNGVEVYTAYGRNLSSPLQIMEPTSFALFFNVHPKEGRSTEIELRGATLEPLEITFSMQNAALITAISSSIFGSLIHSQTLKQKIDRTILPLSVNETNRIERLAHALERANTRCYDDSIATRIPAATMTDTPSNQSKNISIDLTSSQWKLRMTLPMTNITVINDFQGLDDALFRVTFSNLVTGAEGSKGLLLGNPQGTYDFHVNTSVAADFFDSSMKVWQKLLRNPWELTLNSTRGVSKRFRTNRLSTTFDLETYPCHLSFSEQFLVNLSAASRMWSIYSRAISVATGVPVGVVDDATNLVTLEALAANAARNLVISLPYAVENHSGVDAFFSSTGSSTGESDRKSCPSGTIQFFRFDAPPGEGFGGRRLYGQDIVQLKSLTIYVSNARIHVVHMDSEIGSARQAHDIGDGRVLLSHVTRDGKSTILHLGSYVDVHNYTSISFDISIKVGGKSHFVGKCGGTSGETTLFTPARHSLGLHDENVTRKSKYFGIPIYLLDLFQSDAAKENSDRRPCLQLTPRLAATQLQPGSLVGEFNIPSYQAILLSPSESQYTTVFDVTCIADMTGLDRDCTQKKQDPFVLQVHAKVSGIAQSSPFLEISLRPRATIENKTPISLSIRTPMPYTYILSQDRKIPRIGNVAQGDWEHEIIHEVAPNDGLEIFSPSASVAIGVKCKDNPVGGSTTGWMKGDWVDLPMMPEFRLQEPLRCLFPFQPNQRQGVEGSEFFIIEAGDELSESAFGECVKHDKGDPIPYLKPTMVDSMRSYHITVCNYGIDHTGGILFEQILLGDRERRGTQSLDSSIFKRSLSLPTLTPFSAFAATKMLARISLLPGSGVPLRILQLTMDGHDGLRRSLPFRIEDIFFCNGGIESTPFLWEDNTESGFYGYRRLVGTESYQSEIHIIPEFIIYNGSKNQPVLVRQQGGHGPTTEIFLEPGKTAPVRKTGNSGLVLSLLYIEFGGVTPWMRMDDLSHKVVIIRSMDNYPIGSLACQTVIGSTDSRLVVKLGDVQLGESSSVMSAQGDPFADDLLRIRVRWSELRVTLNEATHVKVDDKGGRRAIVESAIDNFLPKTSASKASPRSLKKEISSSKDTWVQSRTKRQQSFEVDAIENACQVSICTVVFHRFTIDWQKIFKDEASNPTIDLLSPQRSQLSMIIHHVQIFDDTPLTPFPIVFDSTSATSFLDLCVRFRGPLNADLIHVDLLDLNVAHINGKSERISLKTSEAFVWKILDVTNRIIVSTAELAGVDIRLEWDEENSEFTVKMDQIGEKDSFERNETIYSPPRSNKLFDVNKVRISPFTIVVSFKRQPHAKRYGRLRGVRGARIMNYFTTKLKFTLDKAELSFSRYEASNLKGPADKLFEHLSAVYMSRMKLKFLSILSAVSFQDWKSLASREEGDDEYQNGDIIRVTGTLAGKSADVVFNKVGYGIGNGLSSLTSRLGDEIETATVKVGAKPLGAGINSVVTGIGDGLGDTCKGVGSGTGKVFKGAGQGIGHIFGGVTGAMILAGNGIGEGVSKGDGRAVLGGFTNGAKSIGHGIGQGVNATVTGAADGVFTAGQGLVSGAKNIGKGIGGAFFGGKKKAKR